MCKSDVKSSISKSKSKVKPNKTQVSKIAYIKRHNQNRLKDKYLSIAKNCNDKFDPEIYQRRAMNVRSCASNLEVAQFSNQKQKIVNMMTCKDRLCGICNYRRSQRSYAKMMRVISDEDFINKQFKFIFLTLTIRNCEPEDLKQSIDHIFYAFDKFLKNKRIKTIKKGYFRGLEITPNEKDIRTFHPHIHCLIVVNSSYFTQSAQYLKHSDLMNIWRLSAGLDYDPWVYIEKVRDAGGIAEITKYVTKTDELIDKLTDYEFAIFRDALVNRRLIGAGGVIRDIAKKLKLNLDDDNIKSDDISDEDIKDEVLLFTYILFWSSRLKKYKIHGKPEQIGF